MKEIKTNPGVSIEQFSESGLRDYFAAKAMQGIINSLYNRLRPGESLPDQELIASDSYRMADKMMEERK